MTGVKSNAVDDSFYRYFTGSFNYVGFMLIMPGSISGPDKKPCLYQHGFQRENFYID
jgi:hypothetical protein